MESRKKWLDKINLYAYEGEFEKAFTLIQIIGPKKGYKLTKKNATEILASCGPDLRLWFIKPLIKMGGVVSDFAIKFAKEVLTNPEAYASWENVPDAIDGFKFIVDLFDQKNIIGGYTDYHHKYLKYKHKYLKFKSNH